MRKEVESIEQGKSLRDLINEFKEQARLRGLSQKSTDIGSSMGEEVERMLRESFSNVLNFSWEREKYIPEAGKRIDFFFEFRDRLGGLFGKIALENKNGNQWLPKSWKEQIIDYVHLTNSFCGVLFIPPRQPGLDEIEGGVTIDNRKFPIFSFDKIDDFRKFLILVLWLAASYTPPPQVNDAIDFDFASDMQQSLIKKCGTICKNYVEFLEKFETLDKKIEDISKNSKILQKRMTQLKERVICNKKAVEEELATMQYYITDKSAALPESLSNELFTEPENDEE
ncbi:hypothetical protein A6V39_04605 [Candidatus Mycoplasma haematobovis]|uniref:Uncharacterized protein n=1 Tax=Candidatus Mycoplasma haematobovis TaxID=432608 RepID=A0A1A9QDZ5_9MOLU|nr:hypothetical protein [Candidatus Mycoplasma haematobovis]OAL10165.1 hypothetical protein A6V39_04605 [Candidatus Mycoplasma haematobovis]